MKQVSRYALKLNELACLCHSFRRNIYNNFKIINLFGIFACGVVRQLLYGKCSTIFLFYVEKSSDYVEDSDISKLRRSAALHPVRCPVRKGYPKTLPQARTLRTLESMPLM